MGLPGCFRRRSAVVSTNSAYSRSRASQSTFPRPTTPTNPFARFAGCARNQRRSWRCNQVDNLRRSRRVAHDRFRIVLSISQRRRRAGISDRAQTIAGLLHRRAEGSRIRARASMRRSDNPSLRTWLRNVGGETPSRCAMASTHKPDSSHSSFNFRSHVTP